MIKAKEMREEILRKKCDKDKLAIIEDLIQFMLASKKMVLPFSKEDSVCKKIEALFNCKEYLEFLGYHVYENAWEVRLEC